MQKIIFLFFFPTLILASQPTDESLLFGLERGISEQYALAIAHFSKIKVEYPDSPAGPFFLSAIYQSRMMDFETTVWKDQFYSEIEKTIQLATAEIRIKPDNPYNYFYLGGAFAYKSFQDGREGKYISAFRAARSAMSNLNKTAEIDSNFCDAFLGMGSYQYWKSQITKRVNWLPLFSDKRDEGINKITMAIECSKFSKWAAISNLAWIYIEEKDFENAILYAHKGLAQFPKSRFFLWPLGDALYKNGEYEKAVDVYLQILKSTQKETFNNGYNEILLHYKIAQCYFHISDTQKATSWCTKGLSINYKDSVQKRANNIKNKITKLMDECSNN